VFKLAVQLLLNCVVLAVRSDRSVVVRC